MLNESVKNEIIENLRAIDPEKVILFGSYAYGSPNQDSDIDLYIVTKEDFIPISYEENLQIKKRVYLALSKFRKNMPRIFLFIHCLFIKDLLSWEVLFRKKLCKKESF